MEKNSTKKKIFNFIKKVDLFNVPFNFKYKNNDKYSTLFGGIISILFILLFIYLFIYSLIPYAKMQNFNVYYYSTNIVKTDKINFYTSGIDIAFGLECDETADDLLDLKAFYINNTNEGDHRNKSQSVEINTHPCREGDFQTIYSNFNYSKLRCFNKMEKDKVIMNTYADKDFFTYYDFNLMLKDSENKNFTRINDYLLNKDCKLELFYTDYSIDINNHPKPIKPYMNSVFLQLSPTLTLEMNEYIMTQNLQDQDNIFNIFDKGSQKTNTVFSRIEQYSLEKGDNRFNPDNNRPIANKDLSYARIFLRADNKKREISRKYQNLLEFFADATSLSIIIYEILKFIMVYFNTFFSYHSLSKSIFFFKDVEDPHLNFYSYEQSIRNILYKKENNQISINANFSKNPQNLTNKQLPNVSTIEMKEPEFPNNRERPKEMIKYSYNIFDIIIIKFFSCCLTDKLSLKKKITAKVDECLSDKLNVLVYIRNTMLLDLFNYILLGEDKGSIIKFLIQPILSIKENKISEKEIEDQKYNHNSTANDMNVVRNDFIKDDIFNNNNDINRFHPLYKSYLPSDFKEFIEDYRNLVNNKEKEKTDIENKLIKYTDIQLKQLME